MKFLVLDLKYAKVYVSIYNAKNINIYHFDVYRLENEEEFFAIGGEEYFEKGICIIEWGELIKNALPKEYIEIKFEKSEDDFNIRNIVINAYGDISNDKINKIKNKLN